MSDDPCEQGIHWIECEGCTNCGRSWDDAMEHAKLMQEKDRRGFRTEPYLGPKGERLIGYATPAREGDTQITEAEAEERLREELRGE